jgi:hypothetical protein
MREDMVKQKLKNLMLMDNNKRKEILGLPVDDKPFNFMDDFAKSLEQMGEYKTAKQKNAERNSDSSHSLSSSGNDEPPPNIP